MDFVSYSVSNFGLKNQIISAITIVGWDRPELLLEGEFRNGIRKELCREHLRDCFNFVFFAVVLLFVNAAMVDLFLIMNLGALRKTLSIFSNLDSQTKVLNLDISILMYLFAALTYFRIFGVRRIKNCFLIWFLCFISIMMCGGSGSNLMFGFVYL